MKEQPKIDEFLNKTKKYSNSSQRRAQLDRQVAVFLAKDMRPAHMLEGDGFLKLVQALDPKYQVPSRRKIARTNLPKLEKEVKDNLKKDLDAAKFGALTTDLWTSRKGSPFIAVTVHFLVGNAVSTKILGCEEFEERHTSKNITERIEAMLQEFNLKEKVVACTTDSGPNIVKAILDTGITQVPCLAHKLNLSVQECLDHFEEVKLLREKVSKIVTYTRRSHIGKREFKKSQEKLHLFPAKSLVLEVRTRWNSCYAMFSRFLEL